METAKINLTDEQRLNVLANAAPCAGFAVGAVSGLALNDDDELDVHKAYALFIATEGGGDVTAILERDYLVVLRDQITEALGDGPSGDG